MQDLLTQWFPNVMDKTDKFWDSLSDTLLMTVWSGVLAFLIGGILGILVVITRKGGILENAIVFRILDTQETDASKAKETQISAEPIIVTVGVVGDNKDEWDKVNENLASENITVELVEFSDYNTPNRALNDGEINLNAFQHYAFFNNEIAEFGYDLVSIGDTILAQLNLYSDKISSPDELKDGDSIAIPNDITNGGRALKNLETIGLIELDPAAGYTPSVNDITKNDLHLKFVELDAATIVPALPDVTAAIINGNYIVDNGMSTSDAIWQESLENLAPDNPYINLIAARTEHKDNEIYAKVVEAYHQENVAKVILEKYNSAYIPVFPY